jgi:hypothetical protein
MKLADFKLLTLEERLDYLFEHSVKDPAQRFADEQEKWRKADGCAHEWEHIGLGQLRCVKPGCKVIRASNLVFPVVECTYRTCQIPRIENENEN